MLKRPLNVDLVCDLRVMGYGKPSFTVDTDEGDGFTFIENYMEGEGPVLKAHYFEEWAEQLGSIVEWCKKEAEKINDQ